MISKSTLAKIEKILKNGDRAELVPVKDGVKVFRIVRREVKIDELQKQEEIKRGTGDFEQFQPNFCQDCGQELDWTENRLYGVHE